MSGAFEQVNIDSKDFDKLINFMKSTYGIDLSNKKQLIASRLAFEIKKLGYADFAQFGDALFKSNDDSMLELVLNKLTTNYTFFMREKEHFEYLSDKLLPKFEKKNKKDRVISIWSAGCSSGEEPYTISMFLKEYFDATGQKWDTRILATDISLQALSKASSGRYSLPADVPKHLLSKYFTHDTTKDLYYVKESLRKNCIFRTYNLMDNFTFKRKFDIIFCRNVMIYFDQKTRDALIDRFCNALVPGGYLFTSHSEPLRNSSSFETVYNAVYKKK